MAENEIPALRLFAGAYEDMHMDKKVKIKAPAKKTSGFFDRGQAKSYSSSLRQNSRFCQRRA